MIQENAVRLGPFLLGLNNVQNDRDNIFDVVEGSNPSLVTATNLDVDDEGWLRRRPGVTSLRSGTNIQGLWNIDGRFFIQENGTLYERTSGIETARVTGLTKRASITKHADAIWVTDGTTFKVIRGTTTYNWGLPVPTITPTASGTGSNLAAGRYLVQASFSDSFGNEGPVCALQALTLTAGQSVVVNCTMPADAALINVYISNVNQKETTFVGSKTSAQLPATFNTYPNASDPPVTHNMSGPISGVVGIFSFRSWMFMWRDNFVIRSEANEPHLFDAINIFQFDDTVNVCVPVINGFFVGTDSGLYYVSDLPGLGSDQDTTGWVPFKKYDGKVYPGGLSIAGSKIPASDANGLMAIFVSDDDLIFAKDDGSIELKTKDRYNFPAASRYTMAYAPGEISKLLVGAVS